jgi:Transposase DDE domain group 1
VKQTTLQKLARRKRRIHKRLRRMYRKVHSHPLLMARKIRYDVADRHRAIACGGIGAVHLMARSVGLPQALDRDIHLLKCHRPYHESDHILSLAYNIVAGGTCIEDLEHLRNDEVFLDALGAARIPDPTTAGDFCRRFQSDEQILCLLQSINRVRVNVWKQQPDEFFNRAVVDVDGTMAPTFGWCKQGMDISYTGQWGYHPLLISLANTQEPLYLVNRSGNRPSHEQADEYLDKAIALCRDAGFRKIALRGDTDFEQTWKLDGWDGAGDILFYFGADARKPLIARAQALQKSAWRRLERPARYEIKTQERDRPENVRQRIVREKKFKDHVLDYQEVAELEHQPKLCKKSYRLIVLRKKIGIERGQERLFEEYRYFMFITNDRQSSTEQIVFEAHDRCNQENLIEQLKNGVRSMRNPLDNLHSNWAYMVMSSLAWTLKAWCGLLVPQGPGRHEKPKCSILKMEFKRFVNGLIRLPCQIIKTGRRIVYRLLAWNPWAATLVRLAEWTRRVDLTRRC